ncbi:MAG: AAA family ATPase [Alphaproteobacteria bacterium]
MGAGLHHNTGRETSILLPDSSVAVFTMDKDTHAAVEALSADWRFGRVDVSVGEGDVDLAIDAYQKIESPDLVILQTDVIDEGFTEKLGLLAECCAEGTAAIVIGPVNDVTLYRTMIDMGISDYLVAPLDVDVFADVIVKALIERIGVMGSKLVAFMGAKGGVGTSAMAQAAALSASEYLEQKSVLLDAAGGGSTLSVGMGFDPVTTLAEAGKVAADQDLDGLERMLFAANKKLSVLAVGGDVMLEDACEVEAFEALIDMLMMQFPVVFVDLSEAPRALQSLVLGRANHIALVSAPSVVSLRQARSALSELRDLRGGDDDGASLIVNMCGAGGKMDIAPKDIVDAVEMDIAASIPFAPEVFMGCEAQGDMVSAHAGGVKILREQFVPMLEGVLGVSAVAEETPPAGGLMGGLLKGLKKG